MSDCIEWQGGRSSSGYGQVRLSNPRRMEGAHRLAYCEANSISLDEIKGKVVRHKCDNRGCVNPDHLEIGTVLDNSRDMVDRGRSARGDKQHLAKLSDADVREIRKRYKRRDPVDGGRALACEFGVTPQAISYVVKGETWRHVSERGHKTREQDLADIVASAKRAQELEQ